MKEELSEQVAVVTGGGRGIGRAIAEQLAGEGAHVVIGDIDLEAARETAFAITAVGGKATALALNVAEEDQVKGFYDKVTAQCGRLDILVNNAGICRMIPILDIEVAEGNFRDDLYYRINTLAVFIPPLRDRPDDIPVLARHFLKQQLTANPPELTDEALEALGAYHWPGNVRELRNIMERLAILRAGQEIQPQDLPRDVSSGRRGDGGGSMIGQDVSLENLERAHIEAVLKKENWHQGRAAETLGISAKTL